LLLPGYTAAQMPRIATATAPAPCKAADKFGIFSLQMLWHNVCKIICEFFKLL